MSMSPSGTSVSSRSQTSWCSRVARYAPRRWMPTRATGRPLFFSTTSCAMRTSVRRMSSSSRTTLYSVKRVPSWPHGTGLKGPCPRGSSRASGQREGGDAEGDRGGGDDPPGDLALAQHLCPQQGAEDDGGLAHRGDQRDRRAREREQDEHVRERAEDADAEDRAAVALPGRADVPDERRQQQRANRLGA